MSLTHGFIIFTTTVFLSLHCFANIDQDEPNWEPVKQGNSPYAISTWTRSIEGAAIKEFRGEVIIKRPIEEVLMLIDDAEKLNDWVFFCRSSKRVGPTEIYMEYNGKWPVKPRYVAISNRASIKDDAIWVHSRRVEGVGPHPDKLINIKTFNNSFKITPISQQQTLVKFTTFVDIGGAIPKWIANYVSRWAPLITLKRMKKILLDPNSIYRGADPHNLSAIADDYRTEIDSLITRVKNELPDIYPLTAVDSY